MIDQKIVIALITLTLTACSTYKKPATLDGKKREPINKFRYSEPPFVIVSPVIPTSTINIDNSKPIQKSVKRQVTPVKAIDILDAEERAITVEKKG